MSLSRPLRGLAVLILGVVAGCADSHPAPVAPEATESLAASVQHRQLTPGESLPAVRITPRGRDVIVEVSRPSLCLTQVSALGAREVGVLSIVARVGSSPLGDCASNFPVAWVVDYSVTIPHVESGTWKVRFFEQVTPGTPTFMREQQVRVP
jgi:hypothetical protein